MFSNDIYNLQKHAKSDKTAFNTDSKISRFISWNSQTTALSYIVIIYYMISDKPILSVTSRSSLRIVWYAMVIKFWCYQDIGTVNDLRIVGI